MVPKKRDTNGRTVLCLLLSVPFSAILGGNRLTPSSRTFAFSFGCAILYEPDELIRHVYFPTSIVVLRLLVLEDGSIAEAGRVGNEGMVGLPVFLGVRTSRTSREKGVRPYVGLKRTV